MLKVDLHIPVMPRDVQALVITIEHVHCAPLLSGLLVQFSQEQNDSCRARHRSSLLSLS